MRSSTRLGSLLAASVIALCVSARAQNIVKDPGFESDTSESINAPNYLSSNDWQVTSGTSYVADFANDAHSGNNYLEISPDSDTSTIQQILNTQSGADYNLSFYYEVLVLDPTTIDFGSNTETISDTTTDGWVPATYNDLSASSSSTALSFSTANEGVFIDDVSVTAVPEPASLGLLSVAGIAIMARRRKSSMA
jgi:PEP-CTERM motif